MPEITAVMGVYVLVASLIAMVVRLWDEPYTEILTKGGLIIALKTFVAALIGISLAMWALIEEGTFNPNSVYVFLSLVALGTLGMEGIRAMITAYNKWSIPPSSPGPPA